MSISSRSGQPAAKEGDKIVAVDIHIVMIPSPAGAVPTPIPMPFNGALNGALSASVFVDDHASATQGSTADNLVPHVPAGGPFQKEPSNKATIQSGSTTIFIDDKPAARLGDPAVTCNDPTDGPMGSVIADGTVFLG